ncbi:MAG TPA: hypothetical protein V6C86_20035 [Oculatellaceae cyanobacterium]
MNTGRIGLKAMTLLAVSMAFTLSLQSAATSGTTFETTEIMACGPLFSIDANADGKTAAQRAAIVQKNLDNALVAAKNRNPDVVQVAFQNHNPIVTLDNFYIVTADKNSAIRNGLSQQQLAERWAESIRHCLMDAKMVDKYVSMLTGKFKTASEKRQVLNRTDVAVLPWGTNLPIALQSDIDIANSGLGAPVTAALVTDVPLGPGFASYIPAGTQALGEMVSAEPNNPNHYGGHHSLMPHFYALRTPDGSEIPISGHVLGGVNSWRAITINPLQPTMDTRVKAERFVDVTQGVSMTGTGGTKLLTETKTETTKISEPRAFNGVIAGAWRGMEEDYDVQEGFPKLMLSPKSRLFIPAGERMTLQLSATTSIAVNSAATPDLSIAAVREVEGM